MQKYFTHSTLYLAQPADRPGGHALALSHLKLALSRVLLLEELEDFCQVEVHVCSDARQLCNSRRVP